MTKSACRCVYQTLPAISVSIIRFHWIRRYTPKSFSTSADFFNAQHTPPATGVFVVNNFLIWYAKNRQEIEKSDNLKSGAQEKVRLPKASIRSQRKKVLVKIPRRQGVVSKDVTHFIASSPVFLGWTHCDHSNHHILQSMVPTRKTTW